MAGLSVHVDPRDATPIWRQIEDQLRLLIGTGAPQSGQPVPSVRDMAQELAVNPATVAKAYRHLTEAGLLEVRRGEGTFVAATPPRAGEAARDRELAVAAGRYAATARALGASRAEATTRLTAAFRELDGQAGGEASTTRSRARAEEGSS